jgi:hypothetical protein
VYPTLNLATKLPVSLLFRRNGGGEGGTGWEDVLFPPYNTLERSSPLIAREYARNLSVKLPDCGIAFQLNCRPKPNLNVSDAWPHEAWHVVMWIWELIPFFGVFDLSNVWRATNMRWRAELQLASLFIEMFQFHDFVHLSHDLHISHHYKK